MPRLSLDGMILPPAARACSLCPRGHKLMWITSEEGGSCDQCARPLDPGEELEECSCCNWWLCQACSAQGRLCHVAPEQAPCGHPPRAESFDSSLMTASAFAAPLGREASMREGTDASLAATERGSNVAAEFYQVTGHRGWAAAPCDSSGPPSARIGGPEAAQREWTDASRPSGPALSTIRESGSSGTTPAGAGGSRASGRCLACGGTGCGLCEATSARSWPQEPVQEDASDDEEDAPADDGAAPFVAPLPPSRVPWLRWSRLGRQPAAGHSRGEEASAEAAQASAAPGVEALREGITVAYWETAAQAFQDCLLKVDRRLNFLRVEAGGKLLASVRLHLITDVVTGPEAAALCAAPLAAGGEGGPPEGAVVVRHGGLGAPLDCAHSLVLVPSEGKDAASCLLDCVKAAPDRQQATECAARVLQRWWRAPDRGLWRPRAEGPAPSSAGPGEELRQAQEVVDFAPSPSKGPRAEAKIGQGVAGADEVPSGLPGLAAGLAATVAPLVKHWGLGELLLPAALSEDPELKGLKGQEAGAGGAAPAGQLLERLRGGLEALGGCAACVVPDHAPARPGAARQATELVQEEAVVARPPAESGACAWGGGPRGSAHQGSPQSTASSPATELVEEEAVARLASGRSQATDPRSHDDDQATELIEEEATARPEGAPRGSPHLETPCSVPATPVLNTGPSTVPGGPASCTASPQARGAWSPGGQAEAADDGRQLAPPPPPRWGWPNDAPAGVQQLSREEQIERAEAEQLACRRAREEAVERERQMAVEALEQARREAEQEQRQARRQAEEEALLEAQLRAERAAREAAARQATPAPRASHGAAGALAPPAAARLPLPPVLCAGGSSALQATPLAEAAPLAKAAPPVRPGTPSHAAAAPLVATPVVPQLAALGG